MLMDNRKVEMRGLPLGQECQPGAGYPEWHFTIGLACAKPECAGEEVVSPAALPWEHLGFRKGA